MESQTLRDSLVFFTNMSSVNMLFDGHQHKSDGG